MGRVNLRQRSGVNLAVSAERSSEHTARVKPGPAGPDIFAHWGILVQVARFKANLSQAGMGRKFGISGQGLINVEAGRRTGSEGLARWVSQSLRISMGRIRFLLAAVSLERILLQDPGVSGLTRQRAIRSVEARGGFRFYRPFRFPGHLQGSPQTIRALRTLLASRKKTARTRSEGERA